ncbi:hypothetical protein LSH36_97g01007 [Paralvinella palmiformis]|uniref:Uncharacterized protein n=1 Tax=Paralvinella palmiformis TaxID=53620 RepID=A0AAD9NCT1_9ANNE|nr:hypothetical protein LSH36_97g01007 [Paralvinella palmiformis]
MYTVAKAPSRLASKATRRGPAQQLDLRTLENFDSGSRERFGPWDMSSPKPVFNGKKHFGRSNSSGSSSLNGMSNSMMTHQDSACVQQHEENVKYMAEAWYRVNHEIDKKQEDGPEIYREKCPHQLQGFEAIDLERWALSRINTKN